MLTNLGDIGLDWSLASVSGLTEEIERLTPSEYSERYRYLPSSVTSMPGPMRFDVNPYMREIVDCFDVDAPFREITLMKGVQITYTTLLESVALYYLAHLGTLPMMFITADRDLAKARIENNFLPMLHHSDLAHIIQTSDVGNKRKDGKNANHIQVKGGGYLVPFGANNADKMRSFSIAVMLKDEVDAWKETVGKDGDPDALSSARCDGYSTIKKIARGSTPLIKGSSKVYKAYLRGDQRKYYVRCLGCGKAQVLRWSGRDEETGRDYGFKWDVEDGRVVAESVGYECCNCNHRHHEHDKVRLFSPQYGAEWRPTAVAEGPDIRSYHLPGLYSPAGFKPWFESVRDYVAAFDTESRRVKDLAKFQVFYNNVLGEPFEEQGAKVTFVAVSSHRRSWYTYGQILNKHIQSYSGGPVVLVTMQVDVHKDNLAVCVLGWVRGMRNYVIDYWRFYRGEDEPDCDDPMSPPWQMVRELIDDKIYTADDGGKHRIMITLIDAGYATDTVVGFCTEWASNVYPVVGRHAGAYGKNIKEFGEYTTQLGTTGFKILVDYYKDRLSSVLRRQWMQGTGVQKEYHFNAPMDASDDQLKELTREYKREKIDPRGITSWEWHRPHAAKQELWDLLVYGHAAVEIVAWLTCVKILGRDRVDWDWFWGYLGG